MIIKATKYNVDNKQIDTKIILMADIHYNDKKDLDLLNALLNRIKKIETDYICITGDFINECDINDEEIFCTWLSSLGEMAKVIISLGNHDLHSIKERRQKINKKLFLRINSLNNVYLLDNDIYEDKFIRFTGFNYGWEHYYKYKENSEDTLKIINNNLKECDCKKYNVLLCHSPLSLCDIENNTKLNSYNLVLSGHTHGGLIFDFLRPIIKHTGFISPNAKGKMSLFNKNVYGYIKDKRLIITSGITKISCNSKFSIFNDLFRSEIVVINIKKETSI